MRRLLLLAFVPLLLSLAPSQPDSAPAPTITLAARDKDRDGGADKGPLPSAAEMERLAREKPVEFLEQCLRHYDRNVKGYTTTMQKQERGGGKLKPTEVIDAAFREDPFSVYMHWVEGARLAEAVVYVEGENNNQMLVRPSGLLARRFIVERDPDGPEAKQSGRYTMKEFGIKKGMERTLASWKEADKKGELHVEDRGDVKVKEAGDRTCICLHRDQYAKPEADGVTDLIIYIDKENWLQVGSVVKGDEDKLLGAYYFRDIHLNPDFKPDQFSRDALKP
jgi:hypothetical protein